MPDFLDVYDELYGPKLATRAPTFRAVLREAVARNVISVVETGTMRKEDNWAGDGQSTIIWNAFMKYVSGSFKTIDLNVDAVELARQVTPDAACVCSDSLDALNRHSSTIDLLYLDSYDLDTANQHPAALHCLFEFCAARPKLKKGSIVFIDDSPMADGWVVTGKGTYVAQYMRQLGVNPFTWGYQVAWIMP